MNIRTTDGTLEEYSVEKVFNDIVESYKSIKEEVDEHLIRNIIDNLFVYENMTSAEIRRLVEDALMSVNKKVARAYISKYDTIDSDKNFKRKKSDYIKNYIKASNAATGSKFDANANVSNKNVVTMGTELYKEENIKENRYLLYDRIKMMYSKKLADRYIYDLETHRIYKHDETAIPGMPYCVAITMYPFLLDGLTGLGGQSKAPTDLKSYCGEFINLVYSVSSQFAGAVATPEFLMYFDFFLRKDYGDDYLLHLNDKVELNTKGRTLEQVIENGFQQVVHSMNMPAGNRGYQSVFWNVGYFDKGYFEGVFGDFKFPDGTSPKWETLSWLQKKFMKWFNDERTRYTLTFPVETMACLTDGNDLVDEEYADFTAEMYADGHSFFTYLSDSPDSLSSCCFSKDTKVLWKSSTKGVNLTTLEELHNTKWELDKKNLRIFHNGSWVKGKSIKLPNREMFKVVTENNKEFIMTDNHINVTFDGEKTTDKLTTNDYLMFNTQVLNAVNENNENLTYDMGFVVGAFLGDGSFGSEINGTIYETNFSQNVNKYQKMMYHLDNCLRQIGSNNTSVLKSVYNNVYPVMVSSKELVAMIQRWTCWERGTYSHNKRLNLDCLLQSVEFRKGILDGWYNTDGGNSNRCYTTSSVLAECMECLITSLGMNSIINVSDRTDEKIVIRGYEYNINHPLYCVRWYENSNHRVNKNSEHTWKKKNNSIYFKIKTIEKIDNYTDDVYCIECNNTDEPYFTLPCGLITHNCRLRNSLKDNEDEEHNHNTHQFSMGTASVATGSKSVMTINLNRIIQNSVVEYFEEMGSKFQLGCKFVLSEQSEDVKQGVINKIKSNITECTENVHKYQTAFNSIIKDFYEANMLDVYRAGFINMRKQYLTVGVNGLTDAAEFLGIDCTDNDNYREFVNDILETINISNKKDKTRECMFNTEFVPGENLSNKNYNWDKKDGYFVSEKHIMYSSYFFNPEDESLSVLEKMRLHGKDYVQYLDGGSACHINLAEHLSKEQNRKLLKYAASVGCNYFTYNVRNTACNKCGYISKHDLDKCPHCGSTDVDKLTRIIGYLKRVKSFAEPRQVEEGMRYYNKNIE